MAAKKLLFALSFTAILGCGGDNAEPGKKAQPSGERPGRGVGWIEKAIQESKEKLRNKNPAVRRLAVSRLGALKARETVPDLIEIAETDESLQVRRIALGALGNIGNQDGCSVLIASLDDDNIEIRKAAIAAISKVEGEDFEAAFIKTLKDPAPEVRGEALKSLHNYINDSNKESLADHIISSLEDRDGRVRMEAARLLGEFTESNSNHAKERLQKLMEDEDAKVACAAAGALAKMGEKKGFSTVQGFLYHKDQNIKIQAADVLGDIGSPAARESLKKLLKKEKDPDMNRYVTRMLNNKAGSQ
ncbi:HEAT repeat domain-containing protein [Fibrobacterota bacterium]